MLVIRRKHLAKMSEPAQKVQDTQPLKIIIAGAGIAGLCAAVALRQAGHNVEVRKSPSFLRLAIGI